MAVKELRSNIKCLFGFHKWKQEQCNNYDVIRTVDNVKSGVVTIAVFTCIRCKKTKIIPFNRTFINSKTKK